MSIESDIVTRLEAYAGLTSLVSTRIYPVKFPQNPTLPAIIYTRIDTQVDTTFENLEVENPRIEFDIIANSYSDITNIVAQLRLAMSGATTFQSIWITDNDLNFDPDQDYYRRTVEFSVWQQ